MKEKLIKKYFGTRPKLESALQRLGIESEGSRKVLEDRLSGFSYKELKSLIE